MLLSRRLLAFNSAKQFQVNLPVRSLHFTATNRSNLPSVPSIQRIVPRPAVHPLSPSVFQRSRASPRRTMVTIDPNSSYTPNAPSPFITAKGPPLDHALEGYKLVPAQDGLPRYAIFDKEIEQSPNDDRTYRLLLLENGMECLIVSDPKTDKASAAMDVAVGHLSDPEDLQGLAHFCEHLMFMGTEKYPAENDYSEFLSQNSGSSNAFTGMDQTCYFFDVDPKELTPALDRFAQFFISPRFDASCAEREANAVHSENSKNLQADMWRMYQLDKSTSSKQHAYWRFGTGNRETLWDEPARRGIDVRERLIEWWQNHYSSNLSKLTVLTKDSLNEATKIIVEKFSPAVNRRLEPPNFPGSPLDETQLKTNIFLKTVRDSRILELTFPLPDEAKYWATKPGSFLSHLVGHEGVGSVCTYLKKQGWINGISAGAGNGARGFEFFKVHIDLSEQGLEKYEDVACTVFAYFELLRKTPPAEWAFIEVAQLSKLAFRFKEKTPPQATAMNLVLNMSRPVPREFLLSAPHLSTEWNPKIVQDLCAKLTPDNCRMMIASQTELPGKTYTEKEKWYGTEYKIEPMSGKLVKGHQEQISELAIPKPNAFVPTDLEIKNKVVVAEPAKRPLSLRNTATNRLWYKKDDRWWVPRAGTFILLRSPVIDADVLRSVQSRFVTALVQDALSEYSYDADLAGLSYALDCQGDGILLTIDGYNDKLSVLAEVVLEKLKNLQIDPERFKMIFDQFKRMFTNNKLAQPYEHVSFTAGYMTSETIYTKEEQLAALEKVSIENVEQHLKQILARNHVEMLVHGNLLKDEALALSKLVDTTLGPTEQLTAQELLSRRALIVPEGKTLTVSPVANSANDQSAIEQLTYIGNLYDDYERCRLAIFALMVQEPLFDQLRAKEQLGYIVSSGQRRSVAFQGLRVIVQSGKPAAFLEERLDAFWDAYQNVLQEMSEQEFLKYRQTVINRRLEDHKNLWEESSHFWSHIHAGWYDFEQRERDVTVLEKITKQEIVDFFQTYFFGTNPQKPIRRLSIHLKSQKLQPDAGQKVSHVSGQIWLDGVMATRPTVAELKHKVKQHLQENGKTNQEIEQTLSEVEALGHVTAPEGVQLVLESERVAWKQAREPAPHASPVAEYSDLIQKL